MILGLFTHIEPLEPTWRMLKENGVRAVEVNHHYLVEKSETEVAAFRQGFEKHGMSIWSIHAPFGRDYNLSSPDETVQLRLVRELERLLPRAALAGVKVIVIHPGFVTPTERRREAGEALVRNLGGLCRLAEREGIRFALENMIPGYIGETAAELLDLVLRVASPSLGVCFDTGHANYGDDFEMSMTLLKEHIITFHLQDNDGTRDLHLQAGYGTVPWGAFVKVLDTMGFTDPLILEAPAWSGAPVGVMLKEVRLLLSDPSAMKTQRLAERLQRSSPPA